MRTEEKDGDRYLKGAASNYRLLFHICAVIFAKWGVCRALTEAEEDSQLVTLI